MFFVCKHAVFTLFAITFIKRQCNAIEDDEDIGRSEIRMDKLQDFNMTYYCKFQANDRVCRDRRPIRRYFYDIQLHKCRQFDYGYCDHSYNLFRERRLCWESCRDDAYAIISDNVTANVYCQYQPDFGDCNSYYPSFYYDVSAGKCKGFSYSGCGGNRNRFPTFISCGDVCQNAIKLKAVKL